MKRPSSGEDPRPALETVEAAVRLLRTAPAGALLAYYAGAIPCLLGLLYFWADMSRGAFAREHLLEGSLAAAGFYGWMKCWQAVAASKLRAHLLQRPEESWTPRRVARLALVQLAVQPTGLFLRLLAANLILPYVWTYAFYQNVTVLGDGTAAGLGAVLRPAARHAWRWPRQTHLALLALSGFALFIWINVFAALALGPALLHMFLGLETPFSRNPMALLNSTTLAATLALTYLCFDPIRKALFVLLCFHGDALKSGEDLRLGLKAVRQRLGATALTLLLLVSGAATAAADSAPPPAPLVQAPELKESLEKVLQRREYAWRFPREEGAEAEQKGWLTLSIEEVMNEITNLKKTAQRWTRQFSRWLDKVFGRKHANEDESSNAGGIDWSSTAWWALVVLATGLLLILGVLVWRGRRGRRAPLAVAQVVAAAPDLSAEDVTADLLPEEGWLRLAGEMMARGEPRLALRALYLAGLAHLGQRQLVLLARHKSNRDYDRELLRRSRSQPAVRPAFTATMEAFERSWYGEHEVTPEVLHGVSEQLEKIRAC